MKKRERVFIVPNLYGAVFGFGIVACLMSASTYSNNLVYALAFFMVGLFLIAMIQANANLKSLEVDRVEFQIAEEEKTSRAHIWLKNNSKEDKILLRVRITEFGKDFFFFADQVGAGSTEKFSFEYHANDPGVFEIEKIQVGSVFPLGLFYSWKVFKLPSSYYVYPRPEESGDLHGLTAEGDSHHYQYGFGGEDFSEHKKYETGEPVQHIDWKALARGRGLLSKKFQDGDNTNYSLSVPEVVSIKQLRQLSFLVHHYSSENISFRLEKNKRELLKMGYGSTHKNLALRCLAEEAKDAV